MWTARRSCRVRFRWMRWPQLLAKVGRDLLAVETPVLDEDLSGLHAGNDNAGQINSGNVAFQGLQITYRPHLRRFKPNAYFPQKIEVRMVTRHGQNEIVLQDYLTCRTGKDNGRGCNRFYRRVKVSLDLCILDAILNVWLDPVLHPRTDSRSAINQRDTRAMPPQLQRGNGS